MILTAPAFRTKTESFLTHRGAKSKVNSTPTIPTMRPIGANGIGLPELVLQSLTRMVTAILLPVEIL